MKKAFLALAMIVASASSALAVGTPTMYDNLITAAGISTLTTSVIAALVTIGAFPLAFMGYKLYQRTIRRA